MQDNILKKRIMRRVYTVYVLRQLFNPAMYRVYLLVGLFGGIASFVSVSNIFANMPSGFAELYNFSLYAFTNTELIVQILTLSLATATLWAVFTIVGNTISDQRITPAY